MKIKKYITAGCLAAMATLLPSCMDLEPKAEMSDNHVWSTAENFQLFANQFYGWLPNLGRGVQDNVHSDFRSDLLCTTNVNPSSQGTNTIPTGDGLYNGNFKNIYYCNLLLKNAPGFSDQEAIKVPVAEAKFFRAMNYFELVQTFGNVTLLTEPLDIDSEALYGPRTDRSQVIDLCVQDLLDAEASLPEQPTENGRLCKDAARGLLSRVALYEGTWQKFHTDGANATSTNARAASLLKIAADAAKRVISGARYSLFKPAALGTEAYRYMFILEDEQCNPAGLVKADNHEYILARRQRTEDKCVMNITHALTTTYNYWATRKLAEMYVCQNGLPIKYNGTVNPQFKGNDVSSAAAEYQNRDNRMNNTLLMPGTKFFDNERSRTAWNDTDFDDSKKYFTAGAPTNASGYAPRKWATERRVTDQYESYDYPVIRLAEVYLNYAEAMFELNNRIDNADLKWLNEVRKRINPNMTELSNELVSANGLSMRDEIRRERTVELFLEGFRIDDLKRWATAPEEMSKDLTGVQITGTWYETGWADHAGRPLDADGCIILYTDRGAWKQTSKLYLYPIPSDQLQLNPALEQNPGW